MLERRPLEDFFLVEKKTTLMHIFQYFFSSYLTFYIFALIAALESNRPAKITGSLVIKDDLVV